MDKETKSLSDRQAAGLAALAKQIVTTASLKAQVTAFKKNEEFSRNNEADQKLVADKLDKQKKFYENILNKLPTDIAVFDPDHRYLFVNPGAISKEEYRKFIIGKDDYQYAEYRNRDISVAHSRRAKFLEVKNTGKEIRWEDSLPDPNGNIITHLRRLYPVYDEAGALSMVIGFGIDITERKIMEEKQASLVKQLSAQNNQLVDFCNIVSHNLRAPLVNISMLAEFIEESEDADEQQLMISKLRPVVGNLHDTFNELVESIQIKQDLEIKTEDICLADCLQKTLDGLQTEINKLQAHIEVDFSKAPVIRYPPKYIRSILDNLVSNSLKYHSPARQPSIELRSEIVDKNIVLSIRDNGLGLDLTKHRDNVFKIGKVFHRHPNAKGFGLFMTKTQVESMGGRIWVESQPDKGTVFFIEFVHQKT
ncbi:MAG TPA: ATP-binding protein [Puia sp.]|nr:ATP-binding protein [Puia sp.]